MAAHVALDTVSLGDARKNRRQVEQEASLGFLFLGTPGLGHLIL